MHLSILRWLAALRFIVLSVSSAPALVITEIHYHPEGSQSNVRSDSRMDCTQSGNG